MFKLVVFCALAGLTAAQQIKDSKEAAIITDVRYLQGSGRHGSQYDQEDGINFKEETDQSGNRVGSYSYYDPAGQKHTISYTAGKDGFHASGDGVPVNSAPAAPLPQYNPPAPAQNWNNQRWNAPAVTERNWDESPDNKWNQWDDPGTWNTASDPTPAPAQQWNNPQTQTWTAPAQNQQWSGPAKTQQQWSAEREQWAAARDRQIAATQAQAQNQQWGAPVQQPAQQPAPQYDQSQWNYDDTTTTPAPHRFYPPGSLNLNRSPDGFSYTFRKV